jgi:hypothetical protein
MSAMIVACCQSADEHAHFPEVNGVAIVRHVADVSLSLSDIAVAAILW